MSEILVTGGCGYIGSVLVRQLGSDSRVDRVLVMDDLSLGSPRALMGSLTDRVEFIRGDVREYGEVEDAMRGCDTVIHLAAITGASSTHDRKEETFETNLTGTDNVLTAARKHGVENIVLASSCNLYGRTTSMELDETLEPDPINPYAESKLEAEKLLHQTAAENGFEGTALRMATNYGDAPGVRFNLVVNRFVFQAVTGRGMTVYGDGSNWRPFIHVRDAARAFVHAALQPESWEHEVYNVGSESENYQISEIASIISEEVAPVDMTYLEQKAPGPSYHVDFGRIEETGYTTEWTLRDGVRDLAERFCPEDSELSYRKHTSK